MTSDIAVELGRSTSEFLRREMPVETIRGAPKRAAGQLRAEWTKGADLGWYSLLVPEQAGGLGCGAEELVVLFKEVGRNLYPGPLIDLVVIAPLVLADAEDALSSDIQEGRAVLLAAIFGPESHVYPEDPWHGAHTDGELLTGIKALVPFADAADVFLVPARREGRPILALVRVDEKVEISPVRSIDPCWRPFTVTFSGVPFEVLAEGEAAETVWRSVEAMSRLATAAETSGVVDRVTTMSVDYAKEREQFGRVIGSFQAVKHMLADLALDNYSLDSLCEYCSQTASEPDALRFAGMVAKVYSAEVGRRAVETALQVHGGIGFTEELDLHLFFKRALTLQGAWGEQRYLERQLGEAVMSSEGVWPSVASGVVL